MSKSESSVISDQKAGQISIAAKWLRHGKTVAMPTETVYGLAASIESPEGIDTIFRIKRRPSFDPLIVHIHDRNQISSIARSWPKTANLLADRFWPGPLTIVVPKHSRLNPMITSGLDTVGIRMPRHPIALALLKAIGVPLAAPSANLFGKTSPTSAEHVRSEFPEAISNQEVLVLEGGESEVGIESTVVSCNDDLITILRPGGVTLFDLQKLVSESGLPGVKVTLASDSNKNQSPGHTEHHYMPHQPLTVFWGTALEISEHKPLLRGYTELFLPADGVLAARKLYAALREADSRSSENGLILFRDTSNRSALDLWLAIDDRLKRAARHHLGKIPC
jgi:L-threonylcarbamoyladenylate synthase